MPLLIFPISVPDYSWKNSPYFPPLSSALSFKNSNRGWVGSGLCVWSPWPLPSGSSVHIVKPWLPSFASVTYVWCKILRGDVLLINHHLMTIWEVSRSDTPDPDINNLCCAVFSYHLGTTVFSLISFLQNSFSSLRLENLYFSSDPPRMDWPIYVLPLPSIPKVLSWEFGV